MVREVKLSWDVTDRRFQPPVCRDSVLDDESPTEKPRKSVSRRRRTAARPAAAKPSPPPQAATERRHLAGADWLSDYAPRLRKAK